jgi:ribosomal protein S18 acetylase RimI-like enzyme
MSMTSIEDQITIRPAAQSDIEGIRQRTDELIGVVTDWAVRLAPGSSARAFVAEDEHGHQVGHIAARPLDVTPDMLDPRFPVAAIPAFMPWWKIDALAVDPSHQGRGAARDLLHAVLGELPPTTLGVYGNVEESRSHAIAWYRRQGFYISTRADLPERADGRSGVRLHGGVDEVFFLGDLRTLGEFAAGRPDRRFETRRAQSDFKHQLRLFKRGIHNREDIGYRLFARAVSERDPSTCVHAGMGPRPLVAHGWDPEFLQACMDCAPVRAQEISHLDDEDLCDGCGARTPETVLSWAAIEERFLIVSVGLCPACRSGDRAMSRV